MPLREALRWTVPTDPLIWIQVPTEPYISAMPATTVKKTPTLNVAGAGVRAGRAGAVTAWTYGLALKRGWPEPPGVSPPEATPPSTHPLPATQWRTPDHWWPSQ